MNSPASVKAIPDTEAAGDDMLQRITDLQPLFRKNADQAREQRKVPQENIDALRDAGLKSFTFFDFTPVGLVVMFSGIAFMTFIGRHLLPQRDVARESELV